MKELPEFSQKNYNIAGYVVSSVVTFSGIYFIYQILFKSDITFSANWNMFDSILMWPLYIIGLLVMFANWNLFSFSYDAYDKITYSDGHTEVKRNWDIIEWLLGHVIIPIFGRFFLVPIMVAALIYYPLMCIVHLLGAIFPYIVVLLVVGIIFVSWKFTSWFQFRYHSWLLVIVGIVMTISFSWGGHALGSGSGCNFPPPGHDTSVVEGDDGDKSDGVDSNDGDDDGDDESDDGDPNEGNDKGGNDSDTDEEDDQFFGVGEEGLYGCLPEGKTEFVGDMEGYPIELSITKSSDMGNITAIYKNVKYGTTMNLTGESLPADGGDISFFGKDGNTDWTFNLSGDCENVTGTAQSEDTELEIRLHKK